MGDYVNLIRELRRISQVAGLSELVKAVIDQSGYLQVLQEDQESYEDRKENLDAMISKAVEFDTTAEEPTLTAFLEELSLKTSLDEAEEDRHQRRPDRRDRQAGGRGVSWRIWLKKIWGAVNAAPSFPLQTLGTKVPRSLAATRLGHGL